MTFFTWLKAVLLAAASLGVAAPALAAEAAPHGASKPVDPLVFDPDLALWTGIVFLGLMAILKAFAFGPISQALADREKNIAGELDAAAAKHAEAKQLLVQHEAKLAAAADEVRAMLEEARRDAEATKSGIVNEARAAAEAERQRAVREIGQARDGAIKGLAEQSARLAVELAAKVVRQEMSPERRSEVVREALGRMGNDASVN